MLEAKTTLPAPLRKVHSVIAVGIACLVAAAALANTASAHVMISPPYLETGTTSEIGFTVPNERQGHVTTSLSVEAPAGITVTLGKAPSGWTGSIDGRVATWSGGRIAGRGLVRFLVQATARTEPGAVVFRATQRYEDGKTFPWSVSLTVLPGTEAESPPQHLRRALTAGAIGLVVIAASLLALRRLRRKPLQER